MYLKGFFSFILENVVNIKVYNLIVVELRLHNVQLSVALKPYEQTIHTIQ